ncbi:MAG: DUF368 domain-containing protein [Saprospiraceae bacterium]|nr:DUF368 domain-containing protein [Saprospiraceae bacterium]
MKLNWYQIAIRGMAMGMAEVVPGVSGGTIAFITGIYERLLDAIKSFHPSLIGVFRREGFNGVWLAIHGWFLLSLLSGMAVGIVIGIFGITWLIDHHPQAIWSFFFGLILASAIWISRQMDQWTWRDGVGLVLASLLAYWITIASPATGTEALWFVLICGMIAISAMLLPGISGSFLLLLMGMYTVVIGHVKGLLETFSMEHALVVGVFAVGCLIGLAGFSRILTWIFHHFHNLALAILTGFMVGSLNRLWPWKVVISTRTNSHGIEVPFLEKSVLPSDFPGEPQLLTVGICVLLGFGLVWLMDSQSPEKALDPDQ